VVELESNEEMEICLDVEDPILMQSQSLEMIVEEIPNKVTNEAVQKKIIMEDQTQANQVSKLPVQAERRSSREVGSGTPMVEKVEKLKASKNIQGITQNSFSILQNIDNDHLAKVAVACDIVLGDNAGMMDEFIDILKAKENAQTEITRLERAKETGKEEVIVEEMVESDDECPKGHCLIVEELTRINESAQEVSLPEVAGGGKKKSRIK